LQVRLFLVLLLQYRLNFDFRVPTSNPLEVIYQSPVKQLITNQARRKMK
jgi:hypothetical protein